jgi:ketosteroid isomerase-like protein
MQKQDNAVEVVKGFLEALGRGDMKKAVASFTDDGVIQMPGSSEMPWAGVWRGRSAIEDYYQVMPQALDIRGATQTRWVSQGNVVVVTGTEHAASRVSGKEYKGTWCWVMVVRGDKIESLESYEDTEAMRSCAPWR